MCLRFFHFSILTYILILSNSSIHEVYESNHLSGKNRNYPIKKRKNIKIDQNRSGHRILENFPHFSDVFLTLSKWVQTIFRLCSFDCILLMFLLLNNDKQRRNTIRRLSSDDPAMKIIPRITFWPPRVCFQLIKCSMS